MALQHIKNRTDILQDYDLELLPEDVSCSEDNVLRVYVNDIVTSPVKIAFLGPGCSASLVPMNTIARYYNNIQLCYGSASMLLSNNEEYPLFFRTAAPESVNNEARVAILQYYAWKRVAIFRNDYDFTTMLSNDLKKILEKKEINIVTEEIFQTNPRFHVPILKAKDVRIIYGFLYENEFRQALCEAYKIGFYGNDIVWINYAYYRARWYETLDVPCSSHELRLAAGNYVTVIAYLQNMDDTQKTISGLTAKQLWTSYKNTVTLMNDSIYDFNEWAGNAYDGMWSLALMLNQSVALFAEEGLELDGFSYDNAKYPEILSSVLYNISFLGMSGSVSFDSNGDRVTTSEIRQMQGDYEEGIAYYDKKNGSLLFTDGRSFMWSGGHLPRDGYIHQVEEIYSVPTSLMASISCFAVIGLVTSLLCSVHILKHRHTRSVKTPSLALMMIILQGFAFLYASVVLLGLQHIIVSSQKMQGLCQAYSWILALAFTFTYGPLLLWKARMYFRFTKRKMVLSARMMLVYIGIFVFVDLCLLTARSILDSPSISYIILSTEVNNEKSIRTTFLHQHCTRNYDLIWACAMYGYKSLLLFQGAIFTMETRNVIIPSAHDTTTNSMAIYVTILTCAVVIPLQMFVEYIPSVQFGLIGILGIVSTSMLLGLVLIPKVLRIRAEIRGDLEDDIFAENPPPKLTLKTTAQVSTAAMQLNQRHNLNFRTRRVHPVNQETNLEKT